MNMRKEDTVKLISAEGFEFVIDRKAALVSNTLRNMLTSTGSVTLALLFSVSFPYRLTKDLFLLCDAFL